jgi:hypothetical protein
MRGLAVAVIVLGGCGGKPPYPATVIQDGVMAVTIATDPSSVYWVEQYGDVMKIPFAGGAITKLTQNATAAELFVDDSTLYWRDSNGDVNRVPKIGGATTVLTRGEFADVLAGDAQSVYWASSGGITTTGMRASNGIWRLDKQSGAVSQIVQSLQVSALASSGGNLFWVDQDGFHVMPAGGGASRNGCCDPRRFLVGPDGLYGFTFDSIIRFSSDASTAVLVSQNPNVLSAVVAGSSLYFTDKNHSGVSRVALAGGSIEVLVRDPMLEQFVPRPIAVSGKWLFWGTGHSIMRGPLVAN